MKVELEIEEAREILLYVADRLAKDAGLDAKDRAALSKWKTSMKPASEACENSPPRSTPTSRARWRTRSAAPSASRTGYDVAGRRPSLTGQDSAILHGECSG